MLIEERSSREERVVDAARQLLTAVRTAPKGRGVDIIEAAVATGDTIKQLSDCMLEIFEQTGRPVYSRDAANILKADAILLVGTRQQPLGLNCAHCGYERCGLKPSPVPCAINSVDIGIALGSAVSRAADIRLDSRIMFSVGMAAERMHLLGPDVRQVYAVSLSASSKNPFFDR